GSCPYPTLFRSGLLAHPGTGCAHPLSGAPWRMRASMRRPGRAVGHDRAESASVADAEADEALQLATGSGDVLGDRRLRVLRERLVQQDDLLEEAVQPALDDLGQSRLGLALVLRGLERDLALLGDRVGRDVV